MDSGSGTTGGGPGRPPCWRTLKESRNLIEGLGSVSLKINTTTTATTESPGDINIVLEDSTIIVGGRAMRRCALTHTVVNCALATVC